MCNRRVRACFGVRMRQDSCGEESGSAWGGWVHGARMNARYWSCSAYSVIHGVAPAEADMQRYFRVSAPSVHQMVVTLEHRGFVARIPGHARPREGICVRSLFHPMGGLQ
jgi:hypothetical protein